MKQITGKTSLICLLGSPVSHSISPLMHNEAFKQLDLDYAYLAFDVSVDQLESAVKGLRTMNARGFNLTMPCKNEILKFCDELSPAAQIMGAVNTVVNENGKLIGHNTDGLGYMKAVQHAGLDIVGKKMTLLGAGGAATAILVQAALDGVSEISVFSRPGKRFDQTLETIAALNKMSSCNIHLYDFSDEAILRREIQESALLTNATSVGMAPNTEVSLITDSSMFHDNLVVSDIIYNPRETKLMKLAKEAGCQTFNGLYMLLYQGAEAFKLWTGKEMPIDTINEAFFKE